MTLQRQEILEYNKFQDSSIAGYNQATYDSNGIDLNAIPVSFQSGSFPNNGNSGIMFPSDTSSEELQMRSNLDDRNFTQSQFPNFNPPSIEVNRSHTEVTEVTEVKRRRRKKNTQPRRRRDLKDKLNTVFNKYEINEFYHDDLLSLRKFDIVIIGDDSGSMRHTVDNSKKTRWDELKQVMNIVCDLGTALDEDGIDIQFLNRSGKKNVTSFNQILPLFRRRPHGYTPLAKSVRIACYNWRKMSRGGKMLLIIATDGEPTTETGKLDKTGFRNVLKNRDCNNIFVSILACSDDDEEVGYLNKIDRQVKNVDVLDDYRSERREVKRAQGRKFPYSFGDHVARLLLGPVFPKYDLLDEVCMDERKKRKKKVTEFTECSGGCAIM